MQPWVDPVGGRSGLNLICLVAWKSHGLTNPAIIPSTQQMGIPAIRFSPRDPDVLGLDSFAMSVCGNQHVYYACQASARGQDDFTDFRIRRWRLSTGPDFY
ncbi:hypothetical protein CKAH01_06699 [Colletotrichum kahawae]|uniref:Uncharacterized protein n=1 Tax=Colletotrichum kahawae TaxID=34407 RepID=A0AAD9Y911_COLKA|nr:hypothetical protein CKAH01_06699 [Colletotrichum kahawae]